MFLRLKLRVKIGLEQGLIPIDLFWLFFQKLFSTEELEAFTAFLNFFMSSLLPPPAYVPQLKKEQEEERKKTY